MSADYAKEDYRHNIKARPNEEWDPSERVDERIWVKTSGRRLRGIDDRNSPEDGKPDSEDVLCPESFMQDEWSEETV